MSGAGAGSAEEALSNDDLLDIERILAEGSSDSEDDLYGGGIDDILASFESSPRSAWDVAQEEFYEALRSTEEKPLSILDWQKTVFAHFENSIPVLLSVGAQRSKLLEILLASAQNLPRQFKRLVFDTNSDQFDDFKHNLAAKIYKVSRLVVGEPWRSIEKTLLAQSRTPDVVVRALLAVLERGDDFFKMLDHIRDLVFLRLSVEHYEKNEHLEIPRKGIVRYRFDRLMAMIEGSVLPEEPEPIFVSGSHKEDIKDGPRSAKERLRCAESVSGEPSLVAQEFVLSHNFNICLDPAKPFEPHKQKLLKSLEPFQMRPAFISKLYREAVIEKRTTIEELAALFDESSSSKLKALANRIQEVSEFIAEMIFGAGIAKETKPSDAEKPKLAVIFAPDALEKTVGVVAPDGGFVPFY